MSTPTSPIDDRDARARAHAARDKHCNPRFSLARHLAQTLTIASMIAAVGIWWARDAEPLRWLWLPAFWLIANVVEWAVHRFAMHRPGLVKTMYRNHAVWHHTSYTHDTMPIRQVADLGLVMMPWYTLVLVFAMASPIVAAIWLVVDQAQAGVFLVSAVLYFLAYEFLHTIYHLSAPSPATAQRPWARVRARLTAHHAHHHRLERMRDVNFNVTVPIADWILGTLEPPAHSK